MNGGDHAIHVAAPFPAESPKAQEDEDDLIPQKPANSVESRKPRLAKCASFQPFAILGNGSVDPQ